MIVSKMTPTDVPAAAALDRRLFSAECWSEEDFASSLQDESRLFLVAREGDTFLGCGGFQQSFEQGDILTVGVDPDHRRMGIGSALLSALIEAFRARGGTTLFLEVRASNAPAVALYEKHGFRRVGVRRNYYQQPTEDGLVYSLEV
ncbi:MAG: ribosomal protein S18-alanine N-acetyltransferase [Clostridia bacterium]|nr:ribosomal protein S18-alanine N-acetyltransferase [Clostridia bacterium]